MNLNQEKLQKKIIKSSGLLLPRDMSGKDNFVTGRGTVSSIGRFARIAPVKADDGRVTSFISVMCDVTYRVHEEQKAHQSTLREDDLSH